MAYIYLFYLKKISTFLMFFVTLILLLQLNQSISKWKKKLICLFKDVPMVINGYLHVVLYKWIYFAIFQSNQTFHFRKKSLLSVKRN